MSVFWLLTQFFLLGLMEGLASKGLEKFVSNHVSKSMRRYGLIFSNFVTGLGKFFSIPFVLLFKSWFKETINTSHLDRYYLALAILSCSFASICVFYLFMPAWNIYWKIWNQMIEDWKMLLLIESLLALGATHI